MKIQPIILAAGKGTRMQSNTPKVLFEIANTPMLGHLLNAITSLQTETPLLVVGYGAQQVTARYPQPIAVQQEQQLGTGHAVAICKRHIQPESTVLVLYGDVPLISAQRLEQVIQAAQTGLGLLTTHLPNPSGYGRIVRNAQGAVTAIVEQKDATAEQLAIGEVNTGILAAKGEQLMRWVSQLSNQNAQGEYYLTDVIAMAVKEGVAINTVSANPNEVAGANNRVQLAQLERLFQMRQAEQLMLQGVSLADPARLDIRGNLQVGQNVSIDVNAVFEGDVTLGDNVCIEPNCVIKNTRIGNNSHIRAFSHIEGASIGEQVTVGPYARLREGTQLGNNSKIGNFVETKKARIGKGSKVNHLSYIGDTTMGEGVNIGAGTITCNYDGKNKHQTIIGDGVFVGSNTALVAPVELGDNCMVGAGSTITKNVPEKDLAIARGKQRNVPNWKRLTSSS